MTAAPRSSRVGAAPSKRFLDRFAGTDRAATAAAFRQAVLNGADTPDAVLAEVRRELRRRITNGRRWYAPQRAERAQLALDLLVELPDEALAAWAIAQWHRSGAA